MTDNEIIKALECLCGGGDSCAECAYHKRYRFHECRKQVAKDALDLVKRQQAEIERLKIENQSLRGAANSYKLHYNEAKAEAAKEFADRLKEKSYPFPCAIGVENAVTIRIIDDLAKEMAGDTE